MEYRALDANLNRAREGLRVLEDVARFVRNDARLTRELRAMRRRLGELARPIASRLLAARDAEGDVGAAAKTTRGSTDDVTAAAFKRVQEALRSIEEFGEGRLRDAASRMRFRVYDLERHSRRDSRIGSVRIYVLITEGWGDPVRAAREAIAGGAGAIQWRAPTMGDRASLRVARRIAAVCLGRALFIVNDRCDIARAAGADGVHLGAADVSVADAREILGPLAIVGRTTHSPAQARGAVREGADYISCGPMFPSRTKPGLPARGRTYLRDAMGLGKPVFAIGGITPETARIVRRWGADRAAVGEAAMAGGRRAVRRISASLGAAAAARSSRASRGSSSRPAAR